MITAPSWRSSRPRPTARRCHPALAGLDLDRHRHAANELRSPTGPRQVLLTASSAGGPASAASAAAPRSRTDLRRCSPRGDMLDDCGHKPEAEFAGICGGALHLSRLVGAIPIAGFWLTRRSQIALRTNAAACTGLSVPHIEGFALAPPAGQDGRCRHDGDYSGHGSSTHSPKGCPPQPPIRWFGTEKSPYRDQKRARGPFSALGDGAAGLLIAVPQPLGRSSTAAPTP